MISEERRAMLERFAVDAVEALVRDPMRRSSEVSTMTKLLVMVYECGRDDANAATVAVLDQAQTVIQNTQKFLARADKLGDGDYCGKPGHGPCLCHRAVWPKS